MNNIILLPTHEIKPYENNPRLNDNAVESVKQSIEEFGFRVPIIIDKNNIIIAGHTRHLAAQDLELKEIPCIIADDLSEEQIKAYRLVDNKVSEFSKWDYKKLEDELLNLSMDMSAFGFETLDDINIDSFFEEAEKPKEEKKEEEKKGVVCPHCGEWIDL